MKTCSFCGKSVYRIAGHGLCANCYYREKRNGTPEYQDRSRKPCSVVGCERLSEAQGLCAMHYRRLRRRGVVEAERYERWGHGTEHPLYDTWRWMTKRALRVGEYEPWSDFWQFVRDVGDRPTSRHSLRRKDLSKQYHPTNVYWKPPTTDVVLDGKRARHAEYMRAYRLAQPERFKHYDLKKIYGIPLAEYEKMRKAQDGVCAICRRPEKSRDRRNGTRHLAVDHCHSTKRIRGLLCSNCNRGLGHFEHAPEFLERAIEYLKWPTRLI